MLATEKKQFHSVWWARCQQSGSNYWACRLGVHWHGPRLQSACAHSSKTSSAVLSHLPRIHSSSSAGIGSSFCDARIRSVRWYSSIWSFFTNLWLEWGTTVFISVQSIWSSLCLLQKNNKDLELEDAIHTAILTLKENFEEQMTVDNIEVGNCSEARFRRFTSTEVKDY